MFQHILFPVDFSERCRAVRPLVQAMAQRHKARVTLIHVIHIPAGWYGGLEGAYPVMFDVPAMEQEARRQLDVFFASPAGAFVGHGDPAGVISEFAHQNGVDLIMMPTHGYGTFRGLLLGSVAAKVLHDAKCKVWTTGHIEAPTPRSHLDCRSILCAIDLSPDSAALIRFAGEIARCYEAKLRLVHAVSAIEGGSEAFLDPEVDRFLMEASREHVRKFQQEAGTDLDVCLERGRVSDVIHSNALRHEAGLIVIGRGRLHKTLGRLRTSAYAIIRDSPCPVLSV